MQLTKKRTMYTGKTKIGVLGGGQLGKMLALAAGPWHQEIHLLDQSADFPAAPFGTRFVEGDFRNFEDVMAFGKGMDIITIEIEHVNVEALYELEKMGKVVHPAPRSLEIIKDKGLQKQFYHRREIPTAPYELFESREAVLSALENGKVQYPFVQKSRTAGYDGKGVAVVSGKQQLDRLLPGPCLIEKKVEIEKELAVIVARNPSGEVAAFPPVEMEFNPVANLVEFLLCPARIPETVAQEAEKLARRVIADLDICGLLAVELFLDKDGKVLVNEVAPRPHNSGHHTIESCYTSQYQQHLRAILDLPLGSTRLKTPAVMVNLLGEADCTGPAKYQGMETCLAVEGVNVHIYGKETTKPFRKMGHVTILSDTAESAHQKAAFVRNTLKVIA